jgi:ribosome-binding protein aMBF1 (putative translation factor)
MIKNERQYKITKSQIQKFSEALQQLSAHSEETNPLKLKVRREALTSQLEELKAEVRTYDALKEGKQRIFELRTFDELPDIFIKARIAAGFSQKDLAERLSLKEQQIQQYEATAYASASLTRIKQVIEALGIQVREDVFLGNVGITLDGLMERMREIGLSKDFLSKRILPPALALAIKGRSVVENVDKLTIQTVATISKVFGLTASTILEAVPLQLDTAAVAAARFKLGARTNESKLNAYTVYVHHMARIVLAATTNVAAKPIPTDADVARAAIIAAYGSVSFENALLYVWDLGIPVLPLNDSGAFHGAFWRINGRNVIVLKQKTQFVARWLNDLLHELYHAGQEPGLHERSVIEAEEGAEERRESDEELEATMYSADVVLDGRAEDLAQMCVRAARGKVESLKGVVPKIAEREGVPTDALANYIAFRLSLDGNANWWGTATNLQQPGINAWEIARDVLLQKIQPSYLDEMDRELLIQALIEI